MHCASHNLNLVVNDAAEALIPSKIQFFETIREIFSFFGSSLNRWAELAFTAAVKDKLKLKKLCTTRWTSRIDAVRAVRNRYTDILRVLSRIVLESRNSKEQSDAAALKKRMERFEFIVCLVLWGRILSIIHSASVDLQSVSMDLSRANIHGAA